MFLAGDVGGTKTLIAVFDGDEREFNLVYEQEYHSAEHYSLTEIVSDFLHSTTGLKLKAACFGIPGIIIDGKCHTTNLPWDVDAAELAHAVGLPNVKLLNDLQTTALGMLLLKPQEFECLSQNAQTLRSGNLAVIAAGTGLGEAVLYWDGQAYWPIATEGGHADFAPRTELEIELLRYLRGRFGEHISYERVLSGPGIHNIYCFLRDSGYAPESQWLADRLKQSADPSALISETGLAGHDELCRQTLRLFAAIYGAEAGNLALRCLATGVYLGGGIAPKLKTALMDGTFMKSFIGKGRLTNFLNQVTVRLSLNERAALLGAAYSASRLLT
jgi:glucokinase